MNILKGELQISFENESLHAWYCGGVAGSGKSTRIIKDVEYRLKKQASSIISVPTKLMVEQYKSNMKKVGVSFVEITYENNSADEFVWQRLISQFINLAHTPNVVLCTHKGLLGAIEQMNDDVIEAALYVDEEMKVFDCGTDPNTEIRGLPTKLAKSLKFPMVFGETVTGVDSSFITESDKYHQIMSKMENPIYNLVHYEVGDFKLAWLFELDMRAIVKKFKKVIFVSALHELSEQSFLMKYQGIELHDIGWGLPDKHYTKRELEIEGVLKHKEWRTNIVGSKHNSPARLEVLKHANSNLPFGEILLVSGDIKTSGLFNNINIKAISHGLNEYKDANYAVELRCSMPCSFEASYLKSKLGMSNLDIRISRYYLQVYQRLMRSSIRCSDTDELLNQKISWVVGDMKLANWLKEQFTGSPNVTVLESSLNLAIDIDISTKARKQRTDKRFQSRNEAERKWCARKLKSCKEHLSNIADQVVVKVMDYCLEERRLNDTKITDTMFIELIAQEA